MKHFLLFYELTPEYLERRSAFRAQHLARGWQAAERGELLLAGAYASPADGAVLLFQGETAEPAERFAREDVVNGLVKRWYAREWTTVVGEQAASPVRLV
jgi:uncharacterized protein YciI